MYMYRRWMGARRNRTLAIKNTPRVPSSWLEDHRALQQSQQVREKIFLGLHFTIFSGKFITLRASLYATGTCGSRV